MTLRSGNCEMALIRLSVSPSLKYSLPGSPVAFTNGNTATESILLVCDLPRRKCAARIAAPISTSKISAAATYFRVEAAWIEPEGVEVAGESPAAEAPEIRPESRSRFSRARSDRISAAL
jgi:hypothetical protein